MKKMIGLICFLMTANAMAFDVGVYDCKNESKESSFTLVRTPDLYSSTLVVTLAGMDSTLQKEFTYSGNEITRAGDSITFSKPGISKSEVVVEEVSPGVILGSLSVVYSKLDDATMNDLMTCVKR